VTKAIIAGGGIGGLTAAVAPRRDGVEVTVFERAPELRELGAGITLWANATRPLKWLGVYDEVRAAGAVEIGGERCSWRGELILEIPADALRKRFREANLAVHRTDLQGALVSSLPPGTVRLGAEFTGFEQDGEGVLARCLGGVREVSSLLRLYEERRVRRTSTVVRRSRLVGRITQPESPLLRSLRDALAKRTSARVQLRQYEQIARYEV
jgi:2-polyprenyl-6-methoxyphenol hydroxylase-like FAD-dependent oxidoreductase